MKQILAITLTVIGFSTTVLAKPAAKNPSIDCSKAAAGKVTIKSVGDRLSEEKAAELAFKCFAKKNKTVAEARKKAIATAREEGSETQCGQAAPLQILTLADWKSERPSLSEGNNGSVNGIVGGSSTVLVREPITCSGLGTGLFSGIVSATAIKLEIEESSEFSMEDDEKPIKQTIELKLQGLVDLK